LLNIVETVGASTPIIEDQAPGKVARDHTDTKQETVPVSPSFSLVSTAAMAVVAGKAQGELIVRSTREDANEIMLMLEKTMEKVCE
jgi:hypothetical protein